MNGPTVWGSATQAMCVSSSQPSFQRFQPSTCVNSWVNPNRKGVSNTLAVRVVLMVASGTLGRASRGVLVIWPLVNRHELDIELAVTHGLGVLGGQHEMAVDSSVRAAQRRALLGTAPSEPTSPPSQPALGIYRNVLGRFISHHLRGTAIDTGKSRHT